MILLSLAPARIMPEFRGELEAAGDGRDVLISRDAAEIEPFLDRIEIGMGDLPYALIPRMPRFKWWQVWSAGADVLQKLPALKDLPFQMSSVRGIHGQPIAEHVFAMLLGWNRALGEAFTAQQQRKWLCITRPLETLNGKTMLILGYGSIGSAIAKVALSFDMKVIGLRRNPGENESGGEILMASADRLGEFLPQADHVVNILPATPATEKYFGAAEFGLMKKSALYINVGRGRTTCEASLVNALKEKRIAGALLDVTEKEPLPESSALWDMDNVILTAHYAGWRHDYNRLAMDISLENLERYKCGEPLKNPIDKIKGY